MRTLYHAQHTRTLLVAAMMVCVFACTVFSAESLLYYEAQAVGGYVTTTGKTIGYSLHPDDAMQHPSIGFDYIGRISGTTGDKASIFLQGRLAYIDDTTTAQGQLYNAYLNVKSSGNNFWVGHNRPAFGLSSVFDTHALLLPTLVMYGYGFDRDWGVGFRRDTDWGTALFSLTSGSGMPLYAEGNYFAAARVGRGVLNRDNYDLGVSLGYGSLADDMGYYRKSDMHIPFSAANVDYTLLWNQYAVRSEYLLGTRDNKAVQSLFLRLGMSMFDEGRGTIEVQPTYTKNGNDEGLYRALGMSYQLTASCTLRCMYHYDPIMNDERIVVQTYIYNRL